MTQVSNDGAGGAFSAAPLLWGAASGGSAAKFLVDDSPPGCPGCGPAGFQASVPVGARVREAWTADVAVGPAVGGTRVTLTAAGLVDGAHHRRKAGRVLPAHAVTAPLRVRARSFGRAHGDR